MKLYKIKTGLLLSLMMILFSCSEDYLDVSPTTDIGEDVVVESVDDLEAALVGAYDFMTYTDYYQGDYLLIADMMGDDFMNPTWSSNWLDGYYNYSWTASANSFLDQYEDIYLGINHINEVLGKAGSIEQTDNYDELVAELRVLRALMYFDVVRLYGPLYTNLGKGDIEADALGVPLVTEPVSDVFASFYRNTVAEVYTFIISELEDAVGNMSTSVSNGYINQYGARALMARVYLYMDNTEDALVQAEEVINNGGYSLLAMSDYVASWGETYTSESIFELAVSEDDNGSWSTIGYYVSPDGYKEVVATSDFIELMEADSYDIRFALLSYDDDVDAYYPNLKYPGRDDNVKVNNPKVLRLSEVYLIAAEAALKEGYETLAGEYLSDLRENRSTTEPRKYDSSVALDDILYERRVELFCEGHRAWDLWRNQESVVRYTSAAEKLEKDHSDDAVGSDGVMEYDYYKNIAPIDDTEIELFPDEDQDSQQNPGY